MSGISLTFPIADGRTVTVSADTPPQLYAMLGKLGGDEGELPVLIKDALTDPTLFASVPATLETASTPVDATPVAAPSSPSDPWADEDPGAQEPADDDPWSTPTSATSPASTGPSPSSPPASARPSSPAQSVTHDKFGRKYNHGLPDAPTCHCGNKAAKMTAQKRNGKGNYSKWVCDLVCDGTDDGWKSKCDYEDWAN